MGSPRPNYDRVEGTCDRQELVGGSRWGPFLGGQINHNSNTNPNMDHLNMQSAENLRYHISLTTCPLIL